MEAAAVDRLNAAYRARFGFPFIIAARLIRDPAVEEATAREEVAQITRMRLDGLVAG
ncbi:2-oxo-4-hydroxy-4-carboxy-5-ureidoimidazoline decarboxylase [Methylobacterium sp. J-072]|uniref:2-oxo-4-hydroxy-4-carboxy-5-ureidoimidazoline decarboxylase n=1 Tax=Methylobacterium sp. J-072 TaxID=2836651 RepID=UPI001FB917AA|nr:2-oxo-4-hydroxy-4-carboxy-5-ureidoimidazoline decarboxylase [Methylobacterium sp. J-072]MCJ2096572.1 2-oxo-4-hydroxy-4-carboxy-5-ureidoimidazoline decarboxylase [Methylobacterium sp. J-072]